ncbi:hypothetical protein BU23DRAFT_156972 [Bimuria novae-zelandiae CBS 107.79]|uniref:Uncharacterized protein n=1 Tax=Bimuria novae-zelandiae CBS 107.79 TaxID=1447943 RepID=A0A6A5V670_9PLEO|nr:hypothetical protein BU23DRAFT_156972 [Bimuria novae-zelandiae CBS 107.79]
MTTLLRTFPVQQSLQFVPYDGPPNRRLPTKKKALSGDNDARGHGEELVHAAHNVEVVDLTCSADKEADYKISSSGRESNDLGSRWNRSHPITNSRIDGASDDETSDDGDRANGDNQSGVADRDDDWPLHHREGSVSYEQNGYAGEVPFGTLKSPNEDYTAERSSQDITSSINDHQVHPMSDGGDEGECPSQRADPSSQNPPGDLALKLNKSEVIDLTDLGDESSDDDEGEGERKCPSSRSRSSSVLQDARYSARPVTTESPPLSPSSGTIRAGDIVPHGDPLFMADTGISSSDQSLQKVSTHAIQDSIVEPRQSQRSEPASDQGKRTW